MDFHVSCRFFEMCVIYQKTNLITFQASFKDRTAFQLFFLPLYIVFSIKRMTISNNILSVVVSILKAKTGKFAVKFFFRLNSHWGLIRSKSSEEPNTWISRDL